MLFFTSQALAVQHKAILRKWFTSCEGSKAKSSSNWDPNWDMKADHNAKGIRQVVLIRHGQYVQGVKGDEHRVLTELGRAQATKTGARLSELIHGKAIYPVRSVRYSTMTRATETYQLILPHLPAMESHQCQPCSMIREGAVCRPDPPSLYWSASDEDFLKDNLRVEAAFRNHIHRSIHRAHKDTHAPAPAPADAAKAPVAAGVSNDSTLAVKVDSLTDEEKGNYADVFVCHGNVIRYFVMRALQLPPEAWLRLAVSNASITVLNIYPSGRVSLYSLGDVGHLPPGLITYN